MKCALATELTKNRGEAMLCREVTPRRILVVDDEYTQRRLFSRFLSSRGFQPITAASGPDALAKARLLRPHLALLDISMPVMDGVHVLKRLRADPAVAGMPVILM